MYVVIFNGSAYFKIFFLFQNHGVYNLKSANLTIYIFQHIIHSIFNDLQYISISIINNEKQLSTHQGEITIREHLTTYLYFSDTEIVLSTASIALPTTN